MGRARTTRTHQPTKWKESEENEMLAWLDYNLEIKPQDGFLAFKQTVSEHLAAECKVSYTYKRCGDKLWNLWKSFGHDDAGKVDVLHKTGSRCLALFSVERRDFIFGRVTELRDRHFRTARRLRSTSHISETPSSVTPRKQRRLDQQFGPKSLVPSVVITSTKAEEINYHRAQHRKTQDPPEPGNNVLSNHSVAGNGSDHTSSHSQATLWEHNVGNDEGVGCSSSEDSEMSDSDEMVMVQPLEQGLEGNIDNRPMATISRLSTENANLRSEVDALKKNSEKLAIAQKQNHSTIVFLQSRLREAEERNRDRRSRDHRLESMEGAWPHGTSPSQKVEELKRTITILEATLDKHQVFRQFIRHSSADEIRLWESKHIREKMSNIGNLMKHALFSYGDRFIPSFLHINLEKHENLAKLFQRSLAVEFPSKDGQNEALTRLTGFTLKAVLRALTAAALYQWVFEANLDQTFLNQSILLDEYRARIRGKDGETYLRNLDFAAHQALFDGPLFQEHIIPKRADELAVRLSKTLAPFFIKEEDLDTVSLYTFSDSFETWGEEERIWAARQNGFYEIFKCALELKYYLLTKSSSKFEAVFSPPQTLFEPENMTAETMEGSLIRTTESSGQDLEVKLCLLPSIYVLQESFTQVMYTNFVNCPYKQRREDDRITEAVVITGPR